MGSALEHAVREVLEQFAYPLEPKGQIAPMRRNRSGSSCRCAASIVRRGGLPPRGPRRVGGHACLVTARRLVERASIACARHKKATECLRPTPPGDAYLTMRHTRLVVLCFLFACASSSSAPLQPDGAAGVVDARAGTATDAIAAPASCVVDQSAFDDGCLLTD